MSGSSDWPAYRAQTGNPGYGDDLGNVCDCGPSPDTAGIGQSGQHHQHDWGLIWPDPLIEREGNNDDNDNNPDSSVVIRLPDLQITQDFLNELGTASLKNLAGTSWYNPQKLAKIHDISTTVRMEAAWMWRCGWGRGDSYKARVVTWRGLLCWGGGLACHVGVTWWVGGDGVLAWRVVWGLVVAGALRAALKGHGGLAWSCAMWQGDVGGSWRAVGGGKVLHAVLGRHGDGLAVEVLHAVLRQHGRLAVAGCWAEMNGGGERARGGGNGLQRPGIAGWRWWRAVSHVGAACLGGDEWRWQACTRGNNGLQHSG
ncbi:hypothetical protein EDB85DRAFT_1886725 [Lactarius pseudohatsudake]|nr:hypothetical protein EDB85DRAFT_1886725 [Lactarius pseudohatsudake]